MRCCSLVLLGLLLAVGLPAQKARHVVGLHRLKPGLAHPLVIDQLPRAGQLDGLNLSLHESVPLKLELMPGKRDSEFKVVSTPRLPIGKFIVPGLLNATLDYGAKGRRAHRWSISSGRGGLRAQSQSATALSLVGYEILFLDLDADGAFGGPADGYVIKPPRQRQWAKPGRKLTVFNTREPQDIGRLKVWFYPDPCGFRGLVTTKEPDYAAIANESYKAALVYLNELRAIYGFPPVSIDEKVSVGCEEHSIYCSLNGMVHVQDSKKEGATPAGARAGMASVLSPSKTMKAGIISWSHTFYHRPDMLLPGLRAVGMGNMGGFAVLDIRSRLSRRDFEPIAWPHDGKTGVPVAWLSGEIPSPVGGVEWTGRTATGWGYPISLTFPTQAITSVKARLLAGEEALDAFVSSPEKPGNPDRPDNESSILIMTRAPLAAKTTYTVEISCLYKGKPFERTWSFTTR